MAAERRQTPSRRQVAPDDEMVLPHSLEAERAVLGAILLHNDAYDRACKYLRAESFYRKAHRDIFTSLARLLDPAHGAADLTLLREDLTKHLTLEEVGGPTYIASLVDGVPRSTNVEHYAAIVKDKALLRECIKVGNTLVTDAYIAEESAGIVIGRADHAIVQLQQGARSDVMARFGPSAYLERLEFRDKHRGELTGIPTGFRSVDELTLGWQRGDMIIVAARPSIGKTVFVVNSAEVAADAGYRVGFFSLEMTKEQLDDRRIAAKTNIDLSRLKSGYLREDEYGMLTQTIGHFSETPFYVDDRSSLTVRDIRSACRRLKSEGGLDLVVVDYIQLIGSALDQRGATRNEEITHASRALKVLAGDLDVAMIVVSQLKRIDQARANREPELDDLRESGSLEQDTDLAFFLHRKNHMEGGPTKGIFKKARNIGGGSVILTLNREICRFDDGGDMPVPTEAETAQEKHDAKTKAIIRNRSRK